MLARERVYREKGPILGQVRCSVWSRVPCPSLLGDKLPTHPVVVGFYIGITCPFQRNPSGWFLCVCACVQRTCRISDQILLRKGPLTSSYIDLWMQARKFMGGGAVLFHPLWVRLQSCTCYKFLHIKLHYYQYKIKTISPFLLTKLLIQLYFLFL